MLNKLLDFDMDEPEDIGNNSTVEEVNMRDMAIIGVSAKFPMADDIHCYWANIANKVECFRDIPKKRKDDVDGFLAYKGTDMNDCEWMPYLEEIDKFDYNFFGISPNEAKLIDPNQRLFLETACNAVDDAGYSQKTLRGSKTGVFVGLSTEFKFVKMLDEFVPSLALTYFPLNLSSYVPGRVAHFLDLIGPSVVVNTACSSSLAAVHYACQAIRAGECNMAIAGSISINLLPQTKSQKLSIVSPDSKVKAFDTDANGTAFGEGVGAILIKPLFKAFEDGDNIYSIIKGSAVNHDGKSIGITAPNPLGQETVLCNAWRDAGINPETISYIEAHGTGTQLGDPIEIQAIQKAFRRSTEKEGFCAVSSVKPNIGHLDCASGIAGLIKAVMALKNNKIPPSINFETLNPKISMENSPVYINTELKEWEKGTTPRRCGVSSFGMSGTNCHVVIEEAPANIKSEADEGQFILTLSAKKPSILKDLVAGYSSFLDKNDMLNIGDICYTLNTGRDHYNCRLAFPVTDYNDLKSKMKYLNSLEGFNQIKESFFYGEHEVVPKIKENLCIGEISEDEINDLNEIAKVKIKQFTEGEKQDVQILKDICALYVKGSEVNWNSFYSDYKMRKVNLPSYPFEKTRSWVDIPDAKDINELPDEQIKKGIPESEKITRSIKLKGREKEDDYSNTERQIAEIWAGLLGVQEINIYDDFFELGGNSLVAVKIEIEMEKVNIPAKYTDLDDYSTIKELAAFIESKKEGQNI
jgi:acyl transferase domain-containing protein